MKSNSLFSKNFKSVLELSYSSNPIIIFDFLIESKELSLSKFFRIIASEYFKTFISKGLFKST